MNTDEQQVAPEPHTLRLIDNDYDLISEPVLNRFNIQGTWQQRPRMFKREQHILKWAHTGSCQCTCCEEHAEEQQKLQAEKEVQITKNFDKAVGLKNINLYDLHATTPQMPSIESSKLQVTPYSEFVRKIQELHAAEEEAKRQQEEQKKESTE